jgi:holliday junction DNA helicase RuvA
MIGRIAGTLLEKTPPLVLVDVQGLGYEIEVPMSTFFNLPPLGQPVALLTHLVVREDAHIVFGFGSAEERSTFRELIRIAGVGPRTALALLSGLSVAEIADAVARQDSGRLVKVPGIGKKTAERLLLELKGRIAPALGGAGGAAVGSVLPPGDERSDIAQALLALGYNDREAQAALKALPAGVGVSEGIKLALRSLTR